MYTFLQIPSMCINIHIMKKKLVPWALFLHLINVPILEKKHWWKIWLLKEKEGREKPHSVTDGCQNKMKPGSVEEIKHECEIRTERHRAEGSISKGIWHQVALWGLIYCQELLGLSFSTDTQWTDPQSAHHNHRCWGINAKMKASWILKISKLLMMEQSLK